MRDEALAEAAARRLDIILEVLGDGDLEEIMKILERDGYETEVNYVNCSPEEARQRMTTRANSHLTPEDNLWCSPARPEYPDKFDYQTVNLATFQREYARRK